MKFIKYFSIIILLFAFAFALVKCTKDQAFDNSKKIESRSDISLLDLLGTSCTPYSAINAGTGCNNVINIDTLVINNVPQYPGCTFKVTYQRLECTFGSLKDVTIGDFQVIEHDCVSFSRDLNNAYNRGILSSFVIDFEMNIWNKIRDHIIQIYVAPSSSPYLCGSGALFQINFTRSSCYRVACYQQKNGLGVGTKITCGSQCCERQTRVCRNPDGTLQITEIQAPPPYNGTNCSGQSFLQDPPLVLKGWKRVWVSDCMNTCP